MITTTFFLSLENLCNFLLAKEKTWKCIFNTNSELSQNRTEKQIMLFTTALNCLFNDMLFSLWLFWLKNWRFSTNSGKGFIVFLMLEFLKAPFSVLNLLYHTLMTFLMMLSVILLFILMILSSLLEVWSVATTRIGFQTWIWSMRHCELGQEVVCWFQCWQNSTGFAWPV